MSCEFGQTDAECRTSQSGLVRIAFAALAAALLAAVVFFIGHEPPTTGQPVNAIPQPSGTMSTK